MEVFRTLMSSVRSPSLRKGDKTAIKETYCRAKTAMADY